MNRFNITYCRNQELFEGTGFRYTVLKRTYTSILRDFQFNLIWNRRTNGQKRTQIIKQYSPFIAGGAYN